MTGNKLVQVFIENARLNTNLEILLYEFQDMVHLLEVENNTSRNRNGVPLQTRPGSPGCYRDPPFIGDPEDAADLFYMKRPDNNFGSSFLMKGFVLPVKVENGLADGHPFRSDDLSKQIQFLVRDSLILH